MYSSKQHESYKEKIVCKIYKDEVLGIVEKTNVDVDSKPLRTMWI